MALYTTHCTHLPITGNKPDLLFALQPFSTDTEDIFRDLNATTAKYGTQSWKPAQPNPSMAEVILGVAKSLEGKNLKNRRTHVVLLSPAAHILHDVSKTCPELCRFDAGLMSAKRNVTKTAVKMSSSATGATFSPFLDASSAF